MNSAAACEFRFDGPIAAVSRAAATRGEAACTAMASPWRVHGELMAMSWRSHGDTMANTHRVNPPERCEAGRV
jgi:hypothetical protein